MPFPVLGSNSAVAGYEIDNSLRFNDDDSARLSRSQTNGNQDKWTWSVWVKRGNISSDQCFFATSNGSTTSFDAKFKSSDAIEIYNYFGGGFDSQLITNRLFRDVSAWYHIVVVYDSGNATESDRLQIYINGTEETSFSTTNYPSLNADSDLNVSGSTLDIGRQQNGSQFFDGYMADTYLIDGQALAPTEFGETNDNGVWIPKAYSGSYGTNGFFLEFQNSGALGTDTSGNGNNFTPTNLTATDQTTDTPTNNFCTLNSLVPTAATFSEGNCKFNAGGSDQVDRSYGTFGLSSGKWYWEFKLLDQETYVGITPVPTDANTNGTTYIGANAYEYGYYSGSQAASNGIYYNNGTAVNTSFSVIADNDIVGIALDLDNNKIYWHVNGTYQNSANPETPTGGISITDPASVTNGAYSPAWGGNAGGSNNSAGEINFGNAPFSISSGNSDANGYGNFEYAVPSGYYALCTKNLAEYG